MTQVSMQIIFTSLILFALLSAGLSEAQTVSDGQALYDQGRFAEAQAVFEAAALQSESALARYWLGMALYRQEKDKEALKWFNRAVKLDNKRVEGYIGAGLVYLRTKNRRLDAREAFRRAERLEPDNPDIQDYLGLTYVSTFGNRREYGIDGRRFFRKAIELAPRHPDAHYHLGLTYEESPGKNYRAAIPHYFDQLLATPGHSDALTHLARCLMKTGRYEEGAIMVEQIAILPGSKDNAMIPAIRAQLYALALEQEKDYAEACTRYEDFIASLAPAEGALYTDLQFVAPESVAMAYHRASEEDKRELWRLFWAARDPDPSTVVNERLVEHYRRVLYARTHFAAAQYPWDRRGEIYIRYGNPDDRQTPLYGQSGSVSGYFPTGNARVDAIREINERLRYRPDSRGFLESWVYVPYNIELFFADQYGNGVFDYPPLTENPRINRFHPATLAKELKAKAPEGYRFDYGGEPLEFIFDAVTYRGDDGRTDIEVTYTVPARQLGYVGDGRGDRTWFRSSVVLRDQELRRVTETTTRIGPIERPLEKIPKKNTRTFLRTAELSLSAPPGFYRSALAVRDSVSKRIGIYEAPLTVWDYRSDALNLSDIKLALAVTPQSEPGPFVRHGMKIIPNPAHLYRQSQPVYFYYEVYNLSLDDQGRTAYRTDLEITAKKKQMHIVWRILSGFGRLMKKNEEDQTTLISFDGEGTGAEEHLFTSIDTGESPAGDYTVSLTITDLHSGQTVTKVGEFMVADDDRQPVEQEERQVEMKRREVGAMP